MRGPSSRAGFHVMNEARPLREEATQHPSALEGKQLTEAFFHGDLDKCMQLIMQKASQKGYSFSCETKAHAIAHLALHTTSNSNTAS